MSCVISLHVYGCNIIKKKQKLQHTVCATGIPGTVYTPCASRRRLPAIPDLPLLLPLNS
jgi:hypothetical protein